MIYNDIITLVKETYTVSDAGDSVAAETQRDVYCTVRSVGLKRKVEAETAGLKIDLRFVIANDADYDDEKIVVHNGKRYNVVSAYVADDESVELDVKKY